MYLPINTGEERAEREAVAKKETKRENNTDYLR